MRHKSTATPPAFASVGEVVKHYRTVTCATAGKPASLRDFAELLGNVNYERVRQMEAGLVEPDKDTLAEWFTHADARVVEMCRQIFITRSWLYLQGHRDTYSLPTFMTTAA